MHGYRRAHDPPAEGLADRLVAEADAEDGKLARRRLDQIEADAGAIGIAGAGRQDDALRLHGHHIGGRKLIVAANLEARAQLAQPVVEVIGEAVIVIDQNKHFQCLRLRGCDAGQLSAAFITGRSGRRKQGARSGNTQSRNRATRRAHAIVARCLNDSWAGAGAAPKGGAGAGARPLAVQHSPGSSACGAIPGRFSSWAWGSASSLGLRLRSIAAPHRASSQAPKTRSLRPSRPQCLRHRQAPPLRLRPRPRHRRRSESPPGSDTLWPCRPPAVGQ